MTRFTAEPCRSCDAMVIWCVTTAGKAMPVDVDPVPAGTIRIEQRGGPNPVARVLTKAELARTGFGAATLRTSHFATCPQADQWRHRKARTS
jgi:hypothetical protein